MAVYRFVPPKQVDTDRIKEGYVFQVRVGDCSDFCKGHTKETEQMKPRRYKAVKKYNKFMLCESLNGFHHHMRCFDYFTLQKVRIIST